MLAVFKDLLCSKLCWHNRPGLTARVKKKCRLNDSPTLNRPDGEPTVFTNPQPYKIYSNTYQLGLKTLEDAFEAIRYEIVNIKKANLKNKHNVTRYERIALKELCVHTCVCVVCVCVCVCVIIVIRNKQH